MHKKDVQYEGYTHHASEDDPQYEIKSDKSGHIAMYKGSALKKLNDHSEIAARTRDTSGDRAT